jgi:hypothetical protein
MECTFRSGEGVGFDVSFIVKGQVAEAAQLGVLRIALLKAQFSCSVLEPQGPPRSLVLSLGN